MAGNERGFLAVILHAHLPYVRHPEYEEALEENWLYEAITETYVPLLLALDRLLADGIDFRLTFSITPTLAFMLSDPLLQSRYLRKLERQRELAEKEVARTKSDPALAPLACMYRRLFATVDDAFTGRYRRNLLGAFRRLQDLGKVELIASAATHGYLPLLAMNEAAVRTQIRLGVEHHRLTFGRQPNGFWLPECGYSPGLDRLLAEQGVRFTILESHGVTRAEERPRYGVHAPLYCPSGVAAFGRDPDSSRQVWSSAEGYPGDFDYREFYRDIGYELDAGYLGSCIHPDGIRIDTGLKYYRITGKTERKEPYVPERAEQKAEMHAAHFLTERLKQFERLAGMMDRKPLVVAPYDAELFGHWWFEGPRWLEHLIRKIAGQDTLRLITLTEYLARYPVNQVATPCLSSWGDKGFSDVWLNERNQWIYPHLHTAAEDLSRLVPAHGRQEGIIFRALNQAARELVLAQASDWAFMIHSGRMEPYAESRVRRHVTRFREICKQVEAGAIHQTWLAEIEAQDHIFPDLNVIQDFGAPSRFQAGAVLRHAARFPAPARPAPLHVVMLSLEEDGFGSEDSTNGFPFLAAALREFGVCVSIVALGGVPAKIAGEIPVYRIGLPDAKGSNGLRGAERVAALNRAAIEALRETGSPDILHTHGWQTALAIVYLKTQPERYPGLAALRAVLTLASARDQGLLPAQEWERLGLDSNLFSPEGLEFYGKVNLLKGGVLFADAVTAASPESAEKMRSMEFGYGMEGIFERRARAFQGIRHGTDSLSWRRCAREYLALYRELLGAGCCNAAKSDGPLELP
jgi:1,4-alpha-glucan branching enzyme